MEDEIDLRVYLEVLIRRWKWIVGITVLVAVVAGIVSLLMPPTYEAESAVALTKSGTDVSFGTQIKTVSELNPTSPSVDPTARRKSLLVIAKSPDMAAAVIAKINAQLEVSERIPSNLANSIDAVIDGDLIRIKAHADNADKASFIANSWLEAFVDYVNRVYGEYPVAEADIQALTTNAKSDYDAKEKAVVEYIGNNPADQLALQIAEKQAIIASLKSGGGDKSSGGTKSRSYLDAIVDARRVVFEQQTAAKTQKLVDLYTVQNKLDRLLSDAKSMRARLSAGSSSRSSGDELANLLLEASAFTTWSTLPVNLQLSLSQLDSTASVGEQTRSLDALIATLEERRKNVQEESSAQSKTLLDNAGSEYLALQLEGLDKILNYAVANKPIYETIDQFQQEINHLQSQLEQENAKKQELVRARDLAWSTYTILANKVAEVQVATLSQGVVVRQAFRALPPSFPIAPKKTQNVAIAAAVGLMLSVLGVYGVEFVQGMRKASVVSSQS